MITSLTELAGFTESQARQFSELYGESYIRRPGLSPSEICRLQSALPQLPDSYLSTVAAIDLSRGVLGYFLLSPTLLNVHDLVSNLIFANDETESPLSAYCHRDFAYFVARCEADPIGVAHANGKFTRNQILIYNVADMDARPRVIADDFLQFLLLAGNLDEIRNRYLGTRTREVAMEEFLTCLNRLHPSVDARTYWLSYAIESLDDAFWD